jgi:hypothetical protein
LPAIKPYNPAIGLTWYAWVPNLKVSSAPDSYESEPYLASRKGRIYHRINISIDVLLNPEKEPILNFDILKTGNLAEQTWAPQASGISIRPHLVDELEGVWLDFLANKEDYQ